MRAFLTLVAVVLGAIGIGVGFVAATQSSRVISLTSNSVGQVSFGTPMAVAIADLNSLLTNSTPKIVSQVGCGTPAAYWPNFTAFFEDGKFVGYDSANPNDLPLKAKYIDAETTAGLRPGDTIAAAERIYGSAFKTYSARGGTWSIATTTGELLGHLKSPPVPTGMSDQIADIGTESFGCPDWPANKNASIRTNAPVQLLGNGIDHVVFGTNESVATTKLDALLGKNPHLSPQKKDCSVDYSALWSTIAVFFSHHRFVGYYSAGLNREEEIDTATARGLQVGNSIGRAESLYGKSFHLSPNGLSWTVSTSTGSIKGNLLSKPKIAGRGDQITNIAAGDVGCAS